MNKFFLIHLLILFSILNSCNHGGSEVTGGDPDVPEETAILLNDQEGKPFELVTIAMEDADIILNDEIYTGKINGNDFKLVYTDDTTLMFIVPDFVPGTYSAGFSIENTDYSFDITILEEEIIQDSGKFVEDYLLTITSDPDYTADPELDDAIQQFGELSENEKLTAARFIANNSALLEDLEREINAYNELDGQGKILKSQTCDFYCKAAQLAKIAAAGVLLPKATATVGAMSAILIGIDVGYSILTGKRSFLFSKIKSIATEILSWVYWPQIKVANLTFTSPDFKELMLELKNNAPKAQTDSLELEAGIEYKIFVDEIPFRTLNAEDTSSPNAIISSLVQAYEAIRTKAEKHFDVVLPGYKNIIEEKTIENLNQVTLSVPGNDVEIASIISGSDHYLIKFNFIGSGIPEKQSFNLVMDYKHQEFSYNSSFNASLNIPTVTDIDGNEYKAVVIKDRVWMAENLRVTRFRNGDSIKLINSDEEWQNIQYYENGYAYPDYDPSNEEIYGLLYHSNASKNEICPVGWELPLDDNLSRDDFGELVYLGINARNLKSKDYWLTEDDDPSVNSTGFTGVPAGFIDYEGYQGLGTAAHFWEENNCNCETGRSLIDGDNQFKSIGLFRSSGASIRCVKK